MPSEGILFFEGGLERGISCEMGTDKSAYSDSCRLLLYERTLVRMSLSLSIDEIIGHSGHTLQERIALIRAEKRAENISAAQ